MTTINATDLFATFGSRVEGVDLTGPIDDAIQLQLRDLIARRKLLLFRQGEITVDQHIALMGVFGRVITEAPDGAMFTRVTNVDPKAYIPSLEKLVYHADYQFTPPGPLEKISLYAEEMHRGEPTNFVNMVLAVDLLPADLRARMENLQVRQMIDYSINFSEARRSRMSARIPGGPDAQYPNCVQPMIRTHQLTGERYVNISQMQTSHVEGWSDEDSDALFAEMEQYAYAPQNLYTHVWQQHDLLVWDNIALQHGREVINNAARRTLRRVAVNPIDGPTLMIDARPDPVRFAPIQWHADEKVA